jgi:hypothetical protein
MPTRPSAHPIFALQSPGKLYSKPGDLLRADRAARLTSREVVNQTAVNALPSHRKKRFLQNSLCQAREPGMDKYFQTF